MPLENSQACLQRTSSGLNRSSLEDRQFIRRDRPVRVLEFQVASQDLPKGRAREVAILFADDRRLRLQQLLADPSPSVGQKELHGLEQSLPTLWPIADILDQPV